MKTKTLASLIALPGLLGSIVSAATIGFNISPSVITNDYVGKMTVCNR